MHDIAAEPQLEASHRHFQVGWGAKGPPATVEFLKIREKSQRSTENKRGFSELYFKSDHMSKST